MNHILLLYKYFLYSRRNDRGKVNLSTFKLHIRYVVKIEESIAKRKKNLMARLSKWDPPMVLFPFKKRPQKHDQMWLVLLILFRTQRRYALRGGGFDVRIKGCVEWVGFFLNFLYKISLMLWMFKFRIVND